MFNLSLDTAVLHRAGGTWEQLRGRGFQLLNRLSKATERFWLSRWYFPAMLLVAACFAAVNQQVAGVAVLVCMATWFLAMCPDILACVCPVAMVFLLAGPQYADLSAFVHLSILVVPFGMALLLHLTLWPVTICAGRSAYGLVLVSIATLLGGCDVMRREEFWSPLSLYYALGLGVVLLAIYLVFRSNLMQKRSYDLCSRFAAIFYTLGLLMAIEVFATYAWRWQEFLECGELLYLNYRNFASTMLLTMLPVTFFFALRSRWNLVGTAVLLLAMLLTGSRSALLFGAVELVLGCLYLVRYGAVSRKVMIGIAVTFAAATALFGFRVMGSLYAGRLVDGCLISGSEQRWTLLARGISDFLHHPVFGMGLGNTTNCELLSGVPGSMFFYHNLPLQVLASMGLLGMVAYGRLIADRVSLLLTKRSAFTMALAMCYAGMLMISMTNPGEFCPFPNAGLMVMVFAMAEEATGDVALPVTQLLGMRRYGHRVHTVTFAHFAHK